jgi:hypothetical protein
MEGATHLAAYDGRPNESQTPGQLRLNPPREPKRGPNRGRARAGTAKQATYEVGMTFIEMLPRSFLLLGLTAGCAVSTPAEHEVNRVVLHGLRSLGLSGIARSDDGQVWAVAEKDHALYRFAEGDWPTTAARIPLAGVDLGLELESGAWLGGDRMALGSERDDHRGEDIILVASIEGDRATVVEGWVVDWRGLFGVDAPPNQGIEGLCICGDQLLVAGEFTLSNGGGRRAPIARGRLEDGGVVSWQPSSLALTSDTGRISGLECVTRDDGISVFAIERHYGVTHILRFELGPGELPDPIKPDLVADIGSRLRDIPNMEGLFFDRDRLVIVTDHDDPSEGDTESLWLLLDGKRQQVVTAGFELPERQPNE